MSESLNVQYCLGTSFGSGELISTLRYCFEELDCSRTPPDSDDTSQFRHISPNTNNRLISGCSVDEAISALDGAASGSVWFWFDDLRVGLHHNTDNPIDNGSDIPIITLLIDEWYAKPWRNDQPSLIREFVLELYDYLSPVYVYGDTYLDESRVSADGITASEIEELYWVNGFGPDMVEQIGRQRLLHAPAWRIDDCDDGGIFFWEAPLPLSQDRQNIDAQLRAYFGVNFDSTG